MSRTARLLEILITLQTKPRFTVQEMADEFGVSRRTMLRDLQALSEMGVPLAASPGPGGGYALIRSRRLLPLALTPEEAVGMVLAYEEFLQYAESPFAAQSLSAVTKLRQSMPADVVRELDRMREHVAMLAPVRSYRAPLLPEVLQAALDRVHLDVVYDSRSGLGRRRIFPFGLYASEGFWYCACHDEKRGHTISLRADRIRALARVEGLEPSPGSLHGWLAARRHDAVEFVCLTARLTERGAKSFEINSLFGEVPVADGVGIIDTPIPASEIDWYARQLLPLGADIVVESPPELIATMQRTAQAIVDLYDGERSG